MFRLIGFLLKTFIAITLTVIFGKWLLGYTGINIAITANNAYQFIMVSGFSAAIGFIIGLTTGLIIGENTKIKQYHGY